MRHRGETVTPVGTPLDDCQDGERHSAANLDKVATPSMDFRFLRQSPHRYWVGATEAKILTKRFGSSGFTKK